ncbi:MAG: type III PLP-dependent enzyme [Bdellovibrionales bacterium]
MIIKPAPVEYAAYEGIADFLRQRGATLTAPVHALRPHIVARQAAYFCNEFPGTAMYAVKVNPDPMVIDTIAANGITAFDVASLEEVKLVAERAPMAELFFMHPVKPRHAIRTAYNNYGVRDFSLDTLDELKKILEETGNAKDLGLHIRLALPKTDAFHGLSNKFGASPELAATLLKKARRHAARVGLCFHVGSQMMNPDAYSKALDTVAGVLKAANVKLDSLDVGGGYPVVYADMNPQPLADYMQAIRDGVARLNLPAGCRILGEPGRAMVAEAGRLICRIDARKNMDDADYLYINDGGYGALFDAAFTGLVYPVRLHRLNGRAPMKKTEPFKLYGPTCDSIDEMPGPFMLPADAREGDIIEFQQTGAYTYALQSRFNGFYGEEVVIFEE